MNAIRQYGELVTWVLGHVTDADMVFVQSVVTYGALLWYVSLESFASHLFKQLALT